MKVFSLSRPGRLIPSRVIQRLNSSFNPQSEFLRIMIERGYFHQCTHLEALDQKLCQGPVVAYLGFDATASSLHVGSLMQLMLLRHFQRCGHKPIVLVGGGTTKIGDPSGKDESRQMLDDQAIQANVEGISSVFEKFLTFGEGVSDATLVDNNEWLSSVKYMDFLRCYGAMFTINRMISHESVKLRLDREQPLTFLEFNYMLLQAFDFLELHRQHQCTLQFGGSDQWGNIVNGIELVRKCSQQQVYGLTSPLVTSADGKKMGKSTGGAIWLNADKLAPYDYWQYWRNTADADVVRFLKLFTDLSLDEIDTLSKLEGAQINEAKVVLADECTKLMHGSECLLGIKQTASSVFSSGEIGTNDKLPRIDISPTSTLSIADVIVKLGLAPSKAETRRLIQGGGVKLDGELVHDPRMRLTAADFSEILVSVGKKRHGVVCVVR